MIKPYHLFQKFSLIIIFFIITSNTFAQFRPPQIAGLKLWLRSDSNIVSSTNGSPVSDWKDCSGNGYDALQATPANQPVFHTNVINGNKPAVRFNGSSDLLVNGGNILNVSGTSMTVFIVASGGAVAAGDLYDILFGIGSFASNGFDITRHKYVSFQRMELFNNSTELDASTNSFPNSGFTYKIIEVEKTLGASLATYFNGVGDDSTSAAGATNAFTNAPYQLGFTAGTYNNYWNGDIAEVIIYGTALSPTNRHIVEQYLGDKYGGKVNLGADINTTGFCSTTLDAGSGFTAYHWSTGASTQTISVNTTGVYSVTATDFFGLTSTDAITVTYPHIALRDTFFCANSSVTLSTGLGAGFTYLWSNNATTPTININTPGPYWVTVTNNGTCSDVSSTIQVTKDNFPNDASLGPNDSLCVGNTIGLVAPIPLPNHLTYLWSPGGSTNPTISISTSGTYSVTVTDSLGCIAHKSVYDTIMGAAPDLHVTISPSCPGSGTQFNVSSVPAGTSYLWDFGDGYNSLQQNPNHIYINPGNPAIHLTVMNGICSKTFDTIIHIPQNPIASFIVDSACIGHPLTFTDQSLSNEGTINSWDWNFGDGTTHATTQNATHTYLAAGNYNVILTIQTNIGCQNSITHPITVVSSAAPPGNFTLYSPINNFSTYDSIINFAWNSSTNAFSYIWQYSTDPGFGDILLSVPDIYGNTYQTTIDTLNDFYWRVLAIGICGDTTYSNVFEFKRFSPSQLPGINLWLRADDPSTLIMNGANVVQWKDATHSGNPNNVAQNDVTKQPLLINNALNNLPVVRFDANAHNYMDGGDILDINTNDFYAFIVGKASNDVAIYFTKSAAGAIPNRYGLYYQGQQVHFYYDDQSNIHYQMDVPRTNGMYELLYSRIVRGDAKMYLNDSCSLLGEKAIYPSYNINSTFNFLLGASLPASGSLPPIGFSSVDIAELIICNASLTPTQLINTQNYLLQKYFPSQYVAPVNLGPDIYSNNLCPVTLDAGSRFSHFIWSNGDTTQTISVSTGGYYSVTATTGCGYSSVDSIFVNKPIIHAHDTIGCFGSSVTLNTGLSSPYAFNWQNLTSTASSFSTIAPDTVRLIVTDYLGCSVTKNIVVSADSFKLKVSIGGNSLSKCIGDTISLAIGANLTVNYLWSDGTLVSDSTHYTITHNLSTGDSLHLTITDNMGCTANFTSEIITHGTDPYVSFIASSACEQDPTHFTNQWVIPPLASVDHFLWNFGDTSTSHLDSLNANPTHLYNTPGIYNTSLTVVTNQGCFKTITEPVYLYSKPQVVFTPFLACTNVPLQFHDQSTCIFGNDSIWQWTINDPNNPQIDSVQNPIHTFDSVGNYNVHLVVISNHGCMNSINENVHVRFAPIVGFSFNNVCDGSPVYFSDTSHTQPQASIYLWNWNFGDGQTSNQENPSTIFINGAGTYPVTLTVKAINGCVSSATDSVTIHGYPNAILTIGDICSNTPVTFNDSSTVHSPDSIVSHLWNFGSYGTSTLTSPTMTFHSNGVESIPVSLTVVSSAGCKDSVHTMANIFPVPVSNFLPDNFYGIAPLQVCFTNNSDSAVNYLWNFGNGEISSLEDPCYTYQYNDTFNVSLVVQNQYGCKDSSSRQIFVIPTRADIAVTNVSSTTQGNFVTLTADITNLGTRSVYAIDIYAKTAGGTVFKETWSNFTNPLLTGQLITYTFNAKYEISQEQATDYICVEAEIVNYNPDDNPANNEQCLALTSHFVAFDPYPTPVNDLVHIDFILPFADQVQIDLYDAKGAYIKKVYSDMGVEGLNKLTLDVSLLNLGVYTYRITFRDNFKILRFVKF